MMEELRLKTFTLGFFPEVCGFKLEPASVTHVVAFVRTSHYISVNMEALSQEEKRLLVRDELDFEEFPPAVFCEVKVLAEPSALAPASSWDPTFSSKISMVRAERGAAATAVPSSSCLAA